MMILLMSLLMALLFMGILAVRRVYFCVPAREVKRMARAGDSDGARLWQAIAFAGSLAILLWLLAGLLAAGSAVALAMALPGWAAVPVIAAVLWLGFAGAAASHPRPFTVRLAVWLAPILAIILRHTQPLFGRLERFTQRHRQIFEHTGLYDKQDVVELLQKQKTQEDSRVLAQDLELLERALQFGDRAASDILTPRDAMPTVQVNDTVGPKLLDELHRSGESTFVVSNETEPVGLVRLDALVRAKQGGSVQAVTELSLAFVRDDFSLHQVLEAFRATRQPLLVVINAFEELVGVVTLENLFQALMGAASTATLAYDDRAAVAASQPPQSRQQAKAEPVDEPTTTAEATEVVE